MENNVSNSNAEYVITLLVMSCLVVQEKNSDKAGDTYHEFFLHSALLLPHHLLSFI